MRCILFITPIDKQPQKLIKLISVDYPTDLNPIRARVFEKVHNLENCCTNRHRIMHGQFTGSFTHVSVIHQFIFFIVHTCDIRNVLEINYPILSLILFYIFQKFTILTILQRFQNKK